MVRNNLKGKNGEDLAVAFLVNKGYKVLATNFRYKKSEVDIIATISNVLVFVEVKYRSNLHYGNPEDFVSEKKEELIHLAADHYIQENGWTMNIRFDIISVIEKEGITHFEDAF